MGNIVTYAETFLKPFEEHSFSSVDSLILSWIIYLHLPSHIPDFYKGSPLRITELFRAENFPALFRNVWNPEDSRRLLTALTASPRFRSIGLLGYKEHTDSAREEQFAAVTFRLNSTDSYIAFRGTDSTLVGWKEDLNMAFQFPVPAQEAAARYTDSAAAALPGKLLLGGHSKGGNLAVYAGAMCGEEIQNRIQRVYSHDGPGFLDSVLKSQPFVGIQDKIDKTAPQSSVVGILLESHENFQVVKSDRVSIWQHDPFSWIVEDDHFVTLPRLTSDANYWDKTLNEWILQLSPAERERFVDSLYQLISVSKAKTFSDLFADWQTNASAVAEAVAHLDSDTRKFLFQVMKKLAFSGIQNAPVLLE